MKHKLMGITAFAILAIWMGCVLCDTQAPASTPSPITSEERVDQAEVNIKAPVSVKVGDVIYIDLSESLGGGFDFEITPKPPGLRTFDEGRIIVCGTGNANITYTVTVSCALEGDSDLGTHKIRVSGAQEVVVPVNPGEGLVDKVGEWALDVDSASKKVEALALADSFEETAGLINDDTLKSIDTITKVTAASNRNALGDNIDSWRPFLDSLSRELKAMSMDDQLIDAEDHAPVWLELSQGLRKYANTLD